MSDSDYGRLYGDMKFNSGEKIDLDLPVIEFKEDGANILYCPALDLSGYGYTGKEALNSLKITIQEYFDYTVKNKTLYEDLSRLGWKIRKNIHRKMVAPSISKSLEANDNFKRIFDNYSFKKTNTHIQVPAFA